MKTKAFYEIFLYYILLLCYYTTELFGQQPTVQLACSMLLPPKCDVIKPSGKTVSMWWLCCMMRIWILYVCTRRTTLTCLKE